MKWTFVVPLPIAVALGLAQGATAQDFPEVQRIANHVLFAERDAANQRQEAERRRVEALDQRTQQQALLLQQQAASVQQLGSDLQAIRAERQVTDLAQSFDAAIVAGQWSLARSLLADQVTIDVPGLSATPAAPVPADAVVAQLQATLARGGVLPRSNPSVRLDGERAVLTATGYGWRLAGRGRAAADQRLGTYEYGFARVGQDWKLDALTFRPAPPG